MTIDNRRQEIVNIIKSKKRIAVKDLAKLTFSSTSTLRRDLIYLEQNGILKRRHGEVIINSLNTSELSHQLRESEHKNEKKIIANLAKDFIGPGMCIYLDSSTTVFELCPYICDIDNLIVFTNGLYTAQTLAEFANPTMKIFITGGEIKHHSASVIHHQVENTLLSHFRIDLAFCSARGIDDAFVYEASLSQALAKKNIIDKSHQTVLLIDHSKFNQTGFFKINNLSQYKAIISDETPDDNIMEAMNKLGVEFIS